MFYDKGILSAINYIGGCLYTCGAAGQVYKKDDNKWNCISNEIVSGSDFAIESFVNNIKLAKNEINESHLGKLIDNLSSYVVFDDIAGDNKDIYVCGNNGLILHWDGIRWDKVKSGTRQHLHSFHYIDKTNIFVCGHHGTILRGNHKEGFRRVPIGRVDENFWSIRYFKGNVYIGTSAGLLCLDLEKINLTNISNEIKNIPAFHAVAEIDSTPDTLWVIADKFVLRLKEKWQVITHPDNF